LNYDPKFHLRYRLDPIDLYVRHTSAFCNSILRRILPWIEPTRYDKTLRMFDNYDELWAPTVGRKSESSWIAAARAAFSRCKDAIVAASADFRAGISSAFGCVSGSLETNWGKQAASSCAVALSTLALLLVDQFLGCPYLMFAYILPILFVTAKFGRTAALGAAVLSSLCAAFFLIEPKFSLEIESSEDLIAWLSFCVTALLISQFSGKRYVRGPIL
jgi:hypothetical protein